MLKYFNTLLFSLLTLTTLAQKLENKPINEEIISSLYLALDIHKPYQNDSLLLKTGYTKLYQSNDIGLTNAWALYHHQERDTYEIVIRGSVNRGLSWLANYYAAMIPAQGELTLEKEKRVSYKFADDDRATVHAGWAIATTYLLEDIQPKLDSLIDNNKKNFIISGHSQGAAIAYLLTAALLQQKNDKVIPNDIVFKTYAIAPPKPGNTYFAYQYELMTNAWSYSITNTQDWVPEIPPTTQTLSDINTLSPFSNDEINQTIKKISWPKRWFARGLLNKIKRPTYRSVRQYEKYLGNFIYKQINKKLTELVEPTYATNSNYVRCSNPIILDGSKNKKYQEKFNNVEDIMLHHNPPAYIYLLKNR